MSTSEVAAQRLERAVEALIRATESLGPELYQLPGDGEWSAMQNLAHVTELVPFWSQRVREVADGLRADRPFGRSPEEWDQRSAAVQDHAADDLQTMIASLRSALTTATVALRAIPEDGWTRSSELEPGEPRQTAADIFEQRIVGHVEAHLRQATDAVARAAARPEEESRSASPG